VHGRTMHPRALDYESLYKGCEGEFPHFFMIFLSLLLFLTKCSLLSPQVSSSSPARRTVVGGRSGGGWPTKGGWRWLSAAAGRRRWRRRRC